MGGTIKRVRQDLLFILLGADDFSLRQSLEEIKGGLGDPALLSANTTILDGQQLTSEQLRTVCETMPFLAERRLVIIQGLLERFEPRVKSRRKVTPASSQQDEYSSLAACLCQVPESTVLVLIDSGVRSGNPLLKQIATKAAVRSFPLLRDAKLKQWIQRHVSEAGGSISPPAVELLAKLVGGNLWIMANEIDKLVLFTSGRRIEEANVRLVVSHGQETNVFAMVDAIFDFKARVAETLLQQLLQKGAAPAYLMAMLSRQIQMIVRAKELRRQRKSEIEIQRRLGLTSEFALRRTLEQAARYPRERLKDVYHELLATDLSIKTGKYDGELALTILVAELCQRRGSR
jgi:DNA polymerase-3 subunit delta